MFVIKMFIEILLCTRMRVYCAFKKFRGNVFMKNNLGIPNRVLEDYEKLLIKIYS